MKFTVIFPHRFKIDVNDLKLESNWLYLDTAQAKIPISKIKFKEFYLLSLKLNYKMRFMSLETWLCFTY